MKNTLLFISLFLNLTVLYGQNTFEKGYFIDNDGRITECFIKNYEWADNPGVCEYKLSETGEVKTEDITSVKEFSVFGSSKFIRANVKIDRSITEITESRNPTWKQELLFLKVLVKGKVSLYYYTYGTFHWFFYSVNDSPIQQLIYKEYLNSKKQLTANVSFRQQLLNDVYCGEYASIAIKSIGYNISELEKYFIRYNECKGESFEFYNKKINKGKFLFKVTAGIDHSSASVYNFSAYQKYLKADFNKKNSFRCGMEAEYILPFSKDKLGIVLEPTYQHYDSQKMADDYFSTIEYNSIQIPLGLRYYFANTKNLNFYANGFINSIFSINLNSKIDVDRQTTLKNHPNASAGLGIEYRMFSFEARYYTKQGLISRFYGMHSEYKRISLVIGCRINKE